MILLLILVVIISDSCDCVCVFVLLLPFPGFGHEQFVAYGRNERERKNTSLSTLLNSARDSVGCLLAVHYTGRHASTTEWRSSCAVVYVFIYLLKQEIKSYPCCYPHILE